MNEIAEVGLDEEKKEIIRRYRKLLRHAKPFLEDGDAKLIKKAFNMIRLMSILMHRIM